MRFERQRDREGEGEWEINPKDILMDRRDNQSPQGLLFFNLYIYIYIYIFFLRKYFWVYRNRRW
jgi:hypothetical protein